MTIYYVIAAILLLLITYRTVIFATYRQRQKEKEQRERLYVIPDQYEKDYGILHTAFLIDALPVTGSSPVQFKLIQMKKLFGAYAAQFPHRDLGPKVEIVEHALSSVTMIIRLRIPQKGTPLYETNTYTFQGNQLSEVMRNLKPLIHQMGVLE